MLIGALALDWSADGQSVFVRRPSPTSLAEVLRYDLVTGSRTTLFQVGPANKAGVELGTLWIAPDGRSYLYSYFRSEDELYVLDGLR